MKKKVKFNKKITGGKKANINTWVIKIIFLTFFISASFSFVSSVLLSNVKILVAFIILIVIILTGILSDIIGVAVTAADETPFHSMSSRKVLGARRAVWLIRNATQISNICNDVIGDICSIISGATGALISAKIILTNSEGIKTIVSIPFSAVIAALTVGGKAAGKKFAITNCNNIVYKIGYIIEKPKRIFHK